MGFEDLGKDSGGNSGKDPSEHGYNWKDIRKDIERETPDIHGFGGNDPYSDEEIARDLAKVKEIKSRPDYKKAQGVADSAVQEYATQQEIGEMDWFGEDLRTDELFGDEDITPTGVCLSSEYDDLVNHVDAVCLMKNSLSDFEPVPFALDLTYTTDTDQLNKKFHWAHRSQNVNVPGFCTVKYYEDVFSAKPMLPKGKIEVMPRFIIGYNEDLSQRITEQRLFNSGGFESLGREEPSTKAKFCVLKELKMQSEQMLGFLSEHHEDSAELEKMYKDVTALDKYFGGAIEVARQHDLHKFEEYSKRDEVFNAIICRNIMGMQKIQPKTEPQQTEQIQRVEDN